MRNTDRLIAVVALLTAAISLSMQLRPAAAHAAPRGPATIGDLGPADALLLADPKAAADAKPLRVSNGDGHIAWSERETSRAWSVGAVNVDKAVKALLAGGSYEEKRKELDEQTSKEDEAYHKRFEEVESKYKDVTPQHPDFERAQAEVNALFDEYRQWQQKQRNDREKLLAGQIEEAYRELVSAVEIVADREHVDLVTRFLPTAQPFESENVVSARDQVLGRVYLKYPEAIDITPAVMKELGVKED